MKLALLFMWAAASLAWAAADSPFTLQPAQQPTEYSIAYKGKTLLTYAFAPQKFKPYVKELATINGYNILRDSPFDHLHHHALMYAIKVNGINFWEELSGHGVEKPVSTAQPVFTQDEFPKAVLRQTIHWLAPQDAFLPDSAKVALLVEQRTLTLTVNEPAREVALQWESEFSVGGKTNQVTLTGANYHGLGMRFLQPLDPIAKHLNSGGAPNLNGRQDVSQHKWGSVSFNEPGNPATIVLFGHPSNTRGDSQFFTMNTPFAYLSATQNLDKEPLTYKTGDKYTLNYLITVYPEVKSPETINARSKSWENSKP